MKQSQHHTMSAAALPVLLGIPFLLLAATLALSLVGTLVLGWAVQDTMAIHDTVGHPPHAHESGWPEVCSTSSGCSYHYDAHIQAEMNWFEAASSFSSPYVPLSVDGAFGSNTREAVKDYQGWEGIQVDGAVGNQTRSSMEYSTFATQLSTGMSPSYGTLRFPIYSTCKAVTVNSGSNVFVPTKSSGEWNAFINNKPGTVSVVNGDCSISGGGGGSGGSGGSGGGGSCDIICDDYYGGCGPVCSQAGCTAAECNPGGGYCVC